MSTFNEHHQRVATIPVQSESHPCVELRKTMVPERAIKQAKLLANFEVTGHLFIGRNEKIDLRLSAAIGIAAVRIGKVKYAKDIDDLIGVHAITSSYGLLSSETGSQTDAQFSVKAIEASVDVSAAKAILASKVGKPEETRKTYELLKAKAMRDKRGFYYKRLSSTNQFGDAETTIIMAILAMKAGDRPHADELCTALLDNLPKDEQTGLYFDHAPLEDNSNSDMKTTLLLSALLNELGRTEESRALFQAVRKAHLKEIKPWENEPQMYQSTHNRWSSQDRETTAWAVVMACIFPEE